MQEVEGAEVQFKNRPPSRANKSVPLIGCGSLLAGLILLLIVAVPFWVWFFWRLEVGPGEIAILIHKTGTDLPAGQILALTPEEKGIQQEVLSEGRYFFNPYSWTWKKSPIVDIPAGKLGVQTRLFGDDLPHGRIIATEHSKGIVREVLRPGKYRINPYAYAVQLFDAINILPGRVGVQTSLVGEDMLNSDLPADERNTFLVPEGLKGVLSNVLDPGSYYLNPYLYNVVEVNLQSQRFEMSGEDAITFLTLDAFTVTVEGTLEYSLMPEKAALLTHQVGDMEDILLKIILPPARGFSRIEGSKNPAKNYIMGDTRQQFQDNLEAHLKTQCGKWGVDIKSVLIRNITPPDEIAGIIRDREVAVQNAKKYEQQIEQAKSKAELTRQEMLALQNKEKVEADTARIRATILAKQEQSVRVTAAEREREVARLENEAAAAQAEAIMLTANADKEVIRLNNEAQTAVIRAQVDAFGKGLFFARYVFYQRVAPKIHSILSGDQRQGLGALFMPLLPEVKKEAL
ncbi:MAG: SPFH domain-containing protein [Kiritimatiellae bacterium]|nr:SPFH domain-containing protein [Kiritimatiellia bacterium]